MRSWPTLRPSLVPILTPRCDTTDTEIMVPSAENPQLSKVSSFKPGVGQDKALHASPAASSRRVWSDRAASDELQARRRPQASGICRQCYRDKAKQHFRFDHSSGFLLRAVGLFWEFLLRILCGGETPTSHQITSKSLDSLFFRHLNIRCT